MPSWIEAEQLVIDCVQGLKGPAGGVDEDFLREVRASYERAVFFCPSLSRLRRLSSSLVGVASALQVMPPRETPGRAAVSAAVNGFEPVSLESILKILVVVQALGERADVPKSLQEPLKLAFPGKVLEPGSIIASLHAPDRELLRQLRQAAAPSESILGFSSNLLAGSSIRGAARRDLYRRLEEGNETRAGNGSFKITRKTAEVIYERLAALPNLRSTLPEFDHVFPVSAVAGPRNGQSSRGLPTSWGNLL